MLNIFNNWSMNVYFIYDENILAEICQNVVWGMDMDKIYIDGSCGSKTATGPNRTAYHI